MRRHIQKTRTTVRTSLRNRLVLGLAGGLFLSTLLIIVIINNKTENGFADTAKTYTLNYPDVTFKRVIRTSDNHFVLTDGKKFIKTDSAGTVLWKKHLETNFSLLIQSFCELSDEGLVAVCQIIGADNVARIYLVKLDKDGNYMWSKVLSKESSEFAYCITAGPDNDFYLCGTGCSTSNFILKMNGAGEQVWAKDLKAGITLGSAQRIAYKDNYLLISGRIQNGSTDELYLLKTDLNGNPVLSRRMTMQKSFNIKVLTFSPDGGYIVSGNYLGASGADNPFILKTDQNMNAIWMHAYGVDGIENINDIAVNGNSELYVVGNVFIDNIQNINTLLFKTDQSGNVLWQLHAGSEQLNGAGYDDGLSIASLNHSGFLIAGFSNGGFITRVDDMGNGFCFQRLLNMSVSDVPIAMLNVSFQQNIISLFNENPITPQAGILNLANPDICYGNTNTDQGSDGGTATGTTSIKDQGITMGIYPNPGNGNITLELNNELTEPGVINVYELSGRLVRSQELMPYQKIQRLDYSQLPAGTYIIQLFDRQQVIANEKMIIMH